MRPTNQSKPSIDHLSKVQSKDFNYFLKCNKHTLCFLKLYQDSHLQWVFKFDSFFEYTMMNPSPNLASDGAGSFEL